MTEQNTVAEIFENEGIEANVAMPAGQDPDAKHDVEEKPGRRPPEDAKIQAEVSDAYTMSLKCEYTQEELMVLYEEMSDQVGDLEGLKEDKAAVSADYNARIKSAEKDLGETRRKLAQRWELRPVECRDAFEYDKGKVLTYRQDTFELVRERFMTEDERQKQLFVENAENVSGQHPDIVPDGAIPGDEEQSRDEEQTDQPVQSGNEAGESEDSKSADDAGGETSDQG